MTLFRDRRDAGRQLAAELQQRTAAAERGSDRSEPPLVLALPRGGVPVAAEVAAALRAPLDVVVVRKLGAPGHEELALGPIALLGIGDEAIERVTATEIVELRRRERAYRGERPPLEVAGREVIVVDDGVATG